MLKLKNRRDKSHRLFFGRQRTWLTFKKNIHVFCLRQTCVIDLIRK